MKSETLVLLIALLFAAGCSSDPVDTPPEDQPPVVSRFETQPSSVRIGGTVTFNYSVSDPDSPLETIVATYEPGATQNVPPGTPSGNLTHQYNTAGTFEAKLEVTSKAKTAFRVVAVNVGADLPPTINISALSTSEGLFKRSAKTALASDPENDPFTVQATSQSASLIVRFDGDSLEYGGATPNVNGIYNLLIRVTDNRSRVVEKTVPVTIDPRDEITGRVSDATSGTLMASVRPALVMQGPFTGFVKIDGIQYSVDPSGNFTSGKLIPGTHDIEAFITNGRDSSFVRRVSVPAGDQSTDVKVNTNAGTGLSLALLRAFYKEANFEAGTVGFGVKGMDFSQGNANTIYLAGKDTTMYGRLHQRLTPQEQDTIELYIVNDWFPLIEVAKRPRIHKAAQGESIPYVLDQNGPRPPPGMGWVFVDNNSGAGGTFGAFYDQTGYKVEACYITLRSLGGLKKVAMNQEIGSWFCSPTGQVRNPLLRNYTIFYEGITSPIPTNADAKLLGLVMTYALGTPLDDLCKLPQ